MSFLPLQPLLLLLSFISLGVSIAADTNKAIIAVTYVVDPSGAGQYKTIQEAINAVPADNNKWYQISVKRGVYREKVTIPQNKPYIYLVGEGNQSTSIEWDDHVNKTYLFTPGTATFTVLADNFVAKYITFKNTYNLGGTPEPVTQALAVRVEGDKAAFYNCGFESLQDTLCDGNGQHYFRDCFISGSVDFIFGRAKSVYENCQINVIQGNRDRPGWVTAQGRLNPTDDDGFVFMSCTITADKGTTYLGRAWGPYSRVVFYKSQFLATIVPQGWDAWNKQSTKSGIVYAEEECSGPGSNKAGRVPWERNLTGAELSLYINDFNNGRSWLPQQPS
ncbi:putative pectinesterase 29 [Acorus calamus]|uniref:Pectinesterase n=1 Tax=Acorus calamus TaxID=4465 RepID=A0AAV9CVL5_ACOCL|nr:putative pectinesterase 29 [Acorus calamus]